MTAIDQKNSDYEYWSGPITIDPEKVLQNIDKIDRLIQEVFNGGGCSDETDSLANDLIVLVYSPDYGD